MLPAWALPLFAGFVSLGLSAQSLLPESDPPSPPPLDADRPGYTEPTGTLTPGFRQMEGGFFRSVEKDHSHSLALPAPLIRYGITPRFELRVQTDGFISLDKVVLNRGTEHHNGTADLAAGFKLRLREEQKSTPALSLIFMLSAPSGHPYFSSSGYDPTVKLSWSKQLPAGISAGGNFNFATLTIDARHQRLSAQSFTLAHPAGPRTSLFAEIYSIQLPGESPLHVVNGGAAFPVTSNLQFDVSIGHSIGPASMAWFASAGFVVRFPHSPHRPGLLAQNRKAPPIAAGR